MQNRRLSKTAWTIGIVLWIASFGIHYMLYIEHHTLPGVAPDWAHHLILGGFQLWWLVKLLRQRRYIRSATPHDEEEEG